VKIQVIYFAKVRDLVGHNEEDLELSENMQVHSLVDFLEKRHTQLQMNGVRVAVNEEFVSGDHLLKPGDVVALIPPVSGG